MTLFGWILEHKLLSFLIVATTALGISTIVLAVDNASLRNITTRPPDTMSKYRLPRNVRPLLYDLYLYPNLTSGLFTGKVNVDVQILSETNSINLHSNLLTIDRVKVDSVIGGFSLNPTYELLTITKPDNSFFDVGNTNLQIDFNGDMKNKIVGLYTSSYKRANGGNSWCFQRFRHGNHQLLLKSTPIPMNDFQQFNSMFGFLYPSANTEKKPNQKK